MKTNEKQKAADVKLRCISKEKNKLF